MSFFDAFFGSTQSQFSAYAILAAVLSICISIILTGTDMTIGNRLLLIFFVILAVIPSILLMLLQITCMVTGGNKDERWWCWLYSWIVAVFVIIYCIFVVIIALSSLFTYNNAISKVDMSEQNNKMSPESSNNYAKMMIQTNSVDAIEKFMNATEDEIKNDINGDLIQEFSTDNKNEITSVPYTPPSSSPPSLSPPSSSSLSPPSSSSLSPPSSSSPSTSPPSSTEMSSLLKNMDEEKKEKFNSKEVLEDEIEPFTNYQYASYN